MDYTSYVYTWLKLMASRDCGAPFLHQVLYSLDELILQCIGTDRLQHFTVLYCHLINSGSINKKWLYVLIK